MSDTVAAVMQPRNEAERLLMEPMQRTITREEWDQIRAYMLARINEQGNITPDA